MALGGITKKISRHKIMLAIVAFTMLLAAGLEYFSQPEDVPVGDRAREIVQSYKWYQSRHRIRLVEHPTDAFLTRLQMIRNARTSIDLCTFIWRDDDAGLALIQELIAAARRGVKVRLLGDGIFFLRRPARVAAMAGADPNLELRLYNPIDHKVTSLEISSLGELLFEFSEVNQRMHLKILTIDGEQTLIGGRNVGNAYFGLDAELNFIDRDLQMTGPAVAEAIKAFESFWNDSRSEKAADLLDVAASAPDNAWLQQHPELARLDTTPVKKQWRQVDKVSVWYDLPGLTGEQGETNSRLLVNRLAALVGGAENSVLIDTPYLVLSERTRKLFENLRTLHPEIDIRFLTNSLASTDNWQTYAAFQSQLRSMLDDLRFMLYLKKPQVLNDRSGGPPDSISCMHAKTLIIDRRLTAIGSFNWDPRSGIWNAEIMVVIDDEKLATDLTGYLTPLWSPENSWVVAERDQSIGLEQIDAIGSTIHEFAAEITGINIWPITNTSCYELVQGPPLSPYHPDFHKRYRAVGSFPDVSPTDQRRILTNLLQPISGPLTPTL